MCINLSNFDFQLIMSSMKYGEKSVIYSIVKPWLQDGLLLSSGTVSLLLLIFPSLVIFFACSLLILSTSMLMAGFI